MSELHFQSRAAEGYDAAVGRITIGVIPHLLREARLEPGLSVLDIAGGTGLAAQSALELVGPFGTSDSAADISPAMLERAKARLSAPNITVAVEDGQNLSYPNDKFDRVICNMGLMYFPNPMRGLSEFRRVTRPGGPVTVSNNRSPGVAPPSHVYRYRIAKHVPSKSECLQMPVFGRMKAELRRMLQQGRVA